MFALIIYRPLSRPSIVAYFRIVREAFLDPSAEFSLPLELIRRSAGGIVVCR